ncbi:MAG: PilZ domain-containing protein [Candidatus Omnitrophica bacterium]|jgi:PilZ domain.|nr:PilZ domain-containing protein [Candidatus Omnitrophota bacterium]
MAAYKYIAKKHGGDSIESIMYAGSEEDARKKIIELGYIPEGIELINTPDRRIHERLDIAVPVWFGVFKSARPVNSFSSQAVTKNISAGGLLIVGHKAMAAGGLLCVRFTLPQMPQSIECLARVVRCDSLPGGEVHLAVCFVNITNDERNALNHYIIEKMNEHNTSGETDGNI